jgi:hypothetical protein
MATFFQKEKSTSQFRFIEGKKKKKGKDYTSPLHIEHDIGNK